MKSKTLILAITPGLLFLMVGPGVAQPPPSQPQTSIEKGRFLTNASRSGRWETPADPAKIVGPIYFVGTRGLGSFLITGSQGHILMYTGMPGSGEMIEKSIVQLGFDPKDVKFILTGHAHVDHVGGFAYLKKATGAKIAMIRQEAPLFESGGKQDFHYAGVQEFEFEPAKVDTIFQDGDEITLGDITLKTYLTAGHTPGSATYVTSVSDGGMSYTVVFPDGTSVNPGYRITNDPSYPGIGDDFRRTFAKLESLKPDIWLAPHNADDDFDAKLARAKTAGVAAWIDPEGYQQFIALKKARFESAVANE